MAFRRPPLVMLARMSLLSGLATVSPRYFKMWMLPPSTT